jgi:hypothetical protein
VWNVNDETFNHQSTKPPIPINHPDGSVYTLISYQQSENNNTDIILEDQEMSQACSSVVINDN